MWTPAFKAFVAPAQARDEVWRTAVSVILAVAVCAFWLALLIVALIITSGQEAARRWMNTMAFGLTPTSLLLNLAVIIGLGIGIAVAVRSLHDRKVSTAIGVNGRPFLEFGLAVLVFVVVIAVFWFAWPGGFALRDNTDMTIWISFLPLALAVVLAQSGAEELLFRGFLQQQLAARFHSAFVWMLVPSLLFGLLHVNVVELNSLTPFILAASLMFGLIAADLTRVTGSIAMGWGYHFANNCFGVLFLAAEGAMSGLALYTTPFSAGNAEIMQPLIVRGMVVSLVIWLILRLLLRVMGQSRV